MYRLKSSLFLFGALLWVVETKAQCESWTNSPMADELENYHVIYKQALKVEDWATAYENWEKVFAKAPLADGKRESHFWDGAEILKWKFGQASDEAGKKMYNDRLIALFNQYISCAQSGGIITASEQEKNNKIAYAYGRMAYEMYYTLNSPYSQNLEAIKNAVKFGGVNNEYIIFDPAASIAVFQYKNNGMPKNDVIELYNQLNEIADYNINNNASLSDYYSQAKENMNGTFAKIEDEIFDYTFFKEKFQPEYESDSDNPDVLKKIIRKLKEKNCPADDPFLVQVETTWAKYATEKNAEIHAEHAANNPAYAAKHLLEAGKFGEAIAKYDEAIAGETDANAKAQFYFAKASIQFRKLSQYSSARSSAYEAAKLKPGWGRPYMLIGDMYGKSARQCGDAWNQRLVILAAMEKYAYAKSIDANVAEEATSRINSYYGSIPDQETGFMRGVKEGSSVNTGCWVSENVRVRYKQ
ncbi:MAG: hypothetical protein IPO65_02875 [Saprospiraceae bacterium]|nr:hypothetical protein [Saprospiraceae bacterium]